MKSRVEVIIKRSLQAMPGLISRHKKHADIELYRVLADCLEIAEVCLVDKDELAVLEKHIGELKPANGNKRVYVEKASDIYQRVCRFVFHGEEHTANMNRYAITIREAAKAGIHSQALVYELASGGGINRFFLKRPNLSDTVSTKTIRLDRPVTHRKVDVLHLDLRRKQDGSYEII